MSGKASEEGNFSEELQGFEQLGIDFEKFAQMNPAERLGAFALAHRQAGDAALANSAHRL